MRLSEAVLRSSEFDVFPLRLRFNSQTGNDFWEPLYSNGACETRPTPGRFLAWHVGDDSSGFLQGM